MKSLILTMLILLAGYANENKIIISGITKHFNQLSSEDQAILKMDAYNETNIGYGYEFNNYSKDSKFFYNIGANVISDSFKNNQYSLAVGYNYLFTIKDSFGIQFGVNAGVARRAVLVSYIDTSLNWEYITIPLVFPRVAVKTKYFDINAIFVPTIDGFNKSGFVHYNIGINF